MVKSVIGDITWFGKVEEASTLSDACIGLTGDGFSPLVMSLVTRLATRVSFAASVRLFRCFLWLGPFQ